ncbi:MAG TPA: lysoplasmalogenase [Marmoricola sp.]|nr:lysoplasmalogenase [Marmoricola sp.]
MEVPRWLAPVGYVGLAAVDTALAASISPSRRRFRLVTKPLLMPALGTAFVGSLARYDVGGGGLLAGGTVAAQALSGVGDIALLGRNEPAFLAGLGSFFGAHVAYTTAFASAGRPLGDRSALGGVVGAAGLFAALAPVMANGAGRRSARLRKPVVAYAGILSTMFAASTRLDPELPVGARRTVVAGTALFLASDTIHAARLFLLPQPTHPAGDAAVMATYTLGQGLIAAGVAQALRSRATNGSVARGGEVGPSFPSTAPPAVPL